MIAQVRVQAHAIASNGRKQERRPQPILVQHSACRARTAGSGPAERGRLPGSRAAPPTVSLRVSSDFRQAPIFRVIVRAVHGSVEPAPLCTS